MVGGAVFLALMLAYRSRPIFLPETRPNDPIAPYRTQVMRRPRLFAWGAAVTVGVVCGLIAQGNWATVQLFVHGGSFGIVDPEFGYDIGFFVFDLPFYRSVLNWLFVAVFLALLASLMAHYLFGGLRVATSKGQGMLTPSARIQLAVLGGTFIVLKAVAYWFDRYWLLSSRRKEPTFTGAGYTDIHAALPAKLVLLAIAVLCAASFFAVIVLRDMRIPAMATALLVLSSIVVGGAWPLLMEQFSVRPNAADAERAYIERNIAATRHAYRIGSDVVDYVDYPGVGTKSPRDVAADVTTIANARLLDPNVLSRTFTQQQQLKNFYSFPAVLDIDRYRIDGELRDYIVGARELSPDSLTGNQTDWINRHTVYTHGNGFVAAPANRVNAAVREAAEASESNSGYPIYAVSDIASQRSGRQIIPVDQPRIYFGEVIAQADPDYAIVGGGPDDAPREYDTDSSKYTYSGAGGVPIGNWFNRTVFATNFAQHRILFSRDIGSESKVIFHRDPKERVQKVAPWLTTDANAVSGSGEREDRLDHRCLHHPGHVPVCAAQLARGAGDQRQRPRAIRHGGVLRAELRQGHRGRLRRHGDAVSGRSPRSGPADMDARLPRHREIRGRHSRRAACPFPLSRGSVQGSARAAGQIPCRRAPRVLHYQRLLVDALRPHR